MATTNNHSECVFPTGNGTNGSVLQCKKEAYGRSLCGYHYHRVLDQNLCQKCFQVKEVAEHRMCQSCFRAQRDAKRQEAFEAGRCVNYWKCDAPAEMRNGMCYECYRERAMHNHEILPVKHVVHDEVVSQVPVETFNYTAPKATTPIPMTPSAMFWRAAVNTDVYKALDPVA